MVMHTPTESDMVCMIRSALNIGCAFLKGQILEMVMASCSLKKVANDIYKRDDVRNGQMLT